MSRPRPQRGVILPMAGDAMEFNSMIGPRDVPNILLQKFDPDLVDCLNADEWLEELEAARIMINWDARRSVLCASRQLRGPAKTWYNDTKAQLTDWDIFGAVMVISFPVTTDAAGMHGQLWSRRMRRRETVSACLYSGLSLARKVGLDDDTVKRYIINGLPTEASRTALLAQNLPFLSALLKAIQETEAAEMEFAKRSDDYRRGGRVECDRRLGIRDRHDARGENTRYQPYQQRYTADRRDGRGQRERRDDRGQQDRCDKYGRHSSQRDVKEDKYGDQKSSSKKKH